MHKFHTVYKVTSDYSNLLFPIVLLILALLSVFFVAALIAYGRKRNNFITKLIDALSFKGKSWEFATFGAIFSVFILGAYMMSAFTFISAYYNNSIQYVEGRVVHFVPMPQGGHANESFAVNEALFEYSKYQLGVWGYHKTSVEGGFIKPGLYVRIAYLNTNARNEILKLEIE